MKINERMKLKFNWKKIKLKYIIFCVVLVFLLDFFGTFTHFFELDYHTKFVYPLDIDIRDVLFKLKNGIQPDIKPINEYNYRFKIKNENKCKITDGKFNEVRLLYVIKSALRNVLQRNAIRNSWGWEKRFSDVTIKRVFILGIDPNDPLLQDKIDEEFNKHNDIIQADFVDTYYNNTIKTMLAFKWVVHNCPRAQYIFFSDDDMYVSTKNILAFIRNPLNIQLGERRRLLHKHDIYNGKLIAGYVFFSPPMRHKISKWYISLKEYPYSKYPPYVTAGAYLVSYPALLDLYYTSLYTKNFRFDDIYLGILARKAEIDPLHNENFYFWKKDYTKDSYASVIASHGYGDPDELLRVWNEQRSLGHA
ncbi:beta-1,3-galactosyltransferase brn [Centruroides vittatus]|uniref:beta-1,3-galactosyltransferase brn n=1 Tax=Centruroides vittatus TaxID=120091 RepID=UPI00350FACD6